MSPEPAMIPQAELDAATGAGVRVMIVDSGVEADHPALKSTPVRCWCLGGQDSSIVPMPKERVQDVFGHGTAVAAIIGEFAPQAELHSLQVLGADLRASSSAVISGLRWAIERGYDVVNCSFGTPNRKYIEDYKRVVDQAFCRNVWLVSACNNYNFGTEEFPAFFPTVISTGFGELAGLTLKRRNGELVEFLARGVRIRAAWKGGTYRMVTGSSFASPHVAAMVSRLRQLRPRWNACQVKSALYALAEAGARAGG